jgi:hypothetical protein
VSPSMFAAGTLDEDASANGKTSARGALLALGEVF